MVLHTNRVNGLKKEGVMVGSCNRSISTHLEALCEVDDGRIFAQLLLALGFEVLVWGGSCGFSMEELVVGSLQV